MNENEHIEEMAKDLCHTYTCEIRKSGIPCNHRCKAHIYATRAIAKGYRKVRHGTWRFGRQNGEPYAECTACGRKMAINCYGYAYCCLCGARMDGGATNDGE